MSATTLILLSLCLGTQTQGIMVQGMYRRMIQGGRLTDSSNAYPWSVYSYSPQIQGYSGNIRTFTGSGIVVAPNAVLAINADRPRHHMSMFGPREDHSVMWRAGSNYFNSSTLDMPGADIMPGMIYNHPFMPILNVVKIEGAPSEASPIDIATVEDIEGMGSGTECMVVGWNVTEGHMGGAGGVMEMVMQFIGVDEMPKDTMPSDSDENDKDTGEEVRPMIPGMDPDAIKDMFTKMVSGYKEKVMRMIGGGGSTATRVDQIERKVKLLNKNDCMEKMKGFGLPNEFQMSNVCIEALEDVEGQCSYPTGTALICNNKLVGIKAGLFDINRCKYKWPEMFLNVGRMRAWIQETTQATDM
ncbi:unnamed protein product [Cyprideis torosa]|uniref:Uncharacterized protein n=1 Tax=Cyprideis torosa TaxID=163714 RepID=A0A7R8WII1_9CRUS|nr:unnamed protein product [Cyprideis torosa]CAG0894164.1 unnamed protein product [Cyprideis torosa]